MTKQYRKYEEHAAATARKITASFTALNSIKKKTILFITIFIPPANWEDKILKIMYLVLWEECCDIKAHQELTAL